jgi:hypothetical protein
MKSAECVALLFGGLVVLALSGFSMACSSSKPVSLNQDGQDAGVLAMPDSAHADACSGLCKDVHDLLRIPDVLRVQEVDVPDVHADEVSQTDAAEMTADSLDVKEVELPCIPDCTDKGCGNDGCGGECPYLCAGDQDCEDGVCVDAMNIIWAHELQGQLKLNAVDAKPEGGMVLSASRTSSGPPYILYDGQDIHGDIWGPYYLVSIDEKGELEWVSGMTEPAWNEWLTIGKLKAVPGGGLVVAATGMTTKPLFGCEGEPPEGHPWTYPYSKHLGRLSPTGECLWSHWIGPDTSGNEWFGLAVAGDAVYLTVIVPGGKCFDFSGGGALDCGPVATFEMDRVAVAKYAIGTGDHLWSRWFGGMDQMALSYFMDSMVADGSDIVLGLRRYAGLADKSLYFEDTIVAGATDGLFQGIIAKVSANGELAWLGQYQDVGVENIALVGDEVVVSGQIEYPVAPDGNTLEDDGWPGWLLGRFDGTGSLLNLQQVEGAWYYHTYDLRGGISDPLTLATTPNPPVGDGFNDASTVAFMRLSSPYNKPDWRFDLHAPLQDNMVRDTLFSYGPNGSYVAFEMGETKVEIDGQTFPKGDDKSPIIIMRIAQ